MTECNVFVMKNLATFPQWNEITIPCLQFHLLLSSYNFPTKLHNFLEKKRKTEVCKGKEIAPQNGSLIFELMVDH